MSNPLFEQIWGEAKLQSERKTDTLKNVCQCIIDTYLTSTNIVLIEISDAGYSKVPLHLISFMR